LFYRCCVRRSTESHCAPEDNREGSAEEEIGVLRVLRRAFQKHRGVREEGHVLVFPVVDFSAFERFKLLKAAKKCRRGKRLFSPCISGHNASAAGT